MEITCDYDASFSPWMAAKHMEAAGVLAKELSCWNEVVDFFKQASALYIECGKVQPGADALIRGARCVTFVKVQFFYNLFENSFCCAIFMNNFWK
jgi:hypothetical protein